VACREADRLRVARRGRAVPGPWATRAERGSRPWGQSTAARRTQNRRAYRTRWARTKARSARRVDAGPGGGETQPRRFRPGRIPTTSHRSSASWLAAQRTPASPRAAGVAPDASGNRPRSRRCARRPPSRSLSIRPGPPSALRPPRVRHRPQSDYETSIPHRARSPTFSAPPQQGRSAQRTCLASGVLPHPGPDGSVGDRHGAADRHRADEPARRRYLDVARSRCPPASGDSRRRPASRRSERRRRPSS